MILDAQNLFDEAAAHLTTEGSTNVIDLGPLQGSVRDIGVGESLHAVVQVTEAFTDAGSDSTMTVEIEADDDVAFGSPEAKKQTLGTFAALSAIGARFVAKLQPEILVKRYIRLKYTVANGNLTTGKFTAFLTKDVDLYRAYADNSSIQ